MSFSRKISMKCGVCGSESFSYDDSLYPSIEDAELIKCAVCNKEYTPSELQEANTIYINQTIEEIGDELIEKELRRLGIKFTKS